jgi:HTH-type transcriptional regulator / antitoxin HigA
MEAMSVATARPDYATLLAKTLPAVIRTEKENERFTALLEELDYKRSRLSAAEERLAELLALLIEDFEERHYALRAATPVQALQELMDANGLKQKDLLGVFGTPSIISEVLAGKRRLTTEHIRRLSHRFHVSPELFLALGPNSQHSRARQNR